jgi:hypothetical protein
MTPAKKTGNASLSVPMLFDDFSAVSFLIGETVTSPIQKQQFLQ